MMKFLDESSFLMSLNVLKHDVATKSEPLARMPYWPVIALYFFVKAIIVFDTTKIDKKKVTILHPKWVRTNKVICYDIDDMI